MKKVPSHLTLLCFICLMVGCAASNSSKILPELTDHEHMTTYQQQLKQSFVAVYKKWQGVPYRLGGTSFNGVDCSAFVQVAIEDGLNISLPRTTRQQVKVGVAVPYDRAQVGDLVFFKTSPNVRHVGVYIGNRQFMHASTSQGVVISRLDNPYWASKFWQFRRVDSSPDAARQKR